jgi:hypothetical protein
MSQFERLRIGAEALLELTSGFAVATSDLLTAGHTAAYELIAYPVTSDVDNQCAEDE